mgnify:CR=1 FL=1
MTNKNLEQKTESKLKKFVKNLDVLVPMKSIFINPEKWSFRKKCINGLCTLALIFGYLPLSVGYEEANPLKIPSAIKEDWARQKILQNEYQIQKEFFPSKLYQKVAGEDGVIDAQEFKNFYAKADSIGGISYRNLSKSYNKK